MPVGLCERVLYCICGRPPITGDDGQGANHRGELTAKERLEAFLRPGETSSLRRRKSDPRAANITTAASHVGSEEGLGRAVPFSRASTTAATAADEASGQHDRGKTGDGHRWRKRLSMSSMMRCACTASS